MSKSKDIVFNFHQSSPPSPITVIYYGRKVEIVNTFKYLDTIFDKRFLNTQAPQRLFLLWKLVFLYFIDTI